MNGSNQEAVVELTGRLVAYPSVNPPGNERAIAEFVADRFESSPVGFAVEVTEVEPDRPNVVARAGDPDRGRLLLTGHLDVVPAEASTWTGDPFELERVGDRIVGRGVSDMKGAIAAKIVAAERYLQRAPDPGEVILAFVVGEETTGFGTEALVEGGISADAAILGEPTNLQPCIAQKGTVRYDVALYGESSHSGRPDEGRSAIDGLYQLLEGISQLDREVRETTHPLLTPGSATVTEIEAGIAPNVIPDHGTATVDWRHLPGRTKSPNEFDERLESILRRIEVGGEPLEYEYDRWLFTQAAEISRDEPIVQTILAATSDVGIDASPIGFNATTDARHLVHTADIPTVLFGPGSLETDAHTVDESIAVADLEATVETYYRTLERFFSD